VLHLCIYNLKILPSFRNLETLSNVLALLLAISDPAKTRQGREKMVNLDAPSKISKKRKVHIFS
jgi:hypothetical protein